MGYSGQGNRTVSYSSTFCDLFRFSCSTHLVAYGSTGMLWTIEGLFACFVFALLLLECRMNGTMPMSPMFCFFMCPSMCSVASIFLARRRRRRRRRTLAFEVSTLLRAVTYILHIVEPARPIDDPHLGGNKSASAREKTFCCLSP